MSDDVLIVGAGIGGLAAALSLHDAGFSVKVAEAVPEIRPLGVGINVLPHATRELDELGLRQRLDEVAVATSTRLLLDRFGNEIFREPLGVEAGYRWPQYSIHRGELQLLLLEAARGRVGQETIETGLRFDRYETRDRGVRAYFVREGGDVVHRDADVLVGADGIHSAVRRQMYPSEGQPLWNGVHMWRGATWTEPFLDARTWILAGSNRAEKLVVYPITPPGPYGQQLINWVAEVRTSDEVATNLGDWQRRGELATVLSHYRGWRFGDWLDVDRMIRGADRIFEYPMVDRDPLPAWTDGRVTLLGDAAHPMYPIGANGATQAILDARYLAWHLWHADDLDRGLWDYEVERRPATGKLVLSNRAGGPERPLTLVAEPAEHGPVPKTRPVRLRGSRDRW
jgi:5-methylphenazine-1-carboxylate 1-monooxygenase